MLKEGNALAWQRMQWIRRNYHHSGLGCSQWQWKNDRFWSDFTANNIASLLEENVLWLAISTRRDMKMSITWSKHKSIMVAVSTAALKVKWPLLVKWLTKMRWRHFWLVFRDAFMCKFIFLRTFVPETYEPRWKSVGRCSHLPASQLVLGEFCFCWFRVVIFRFFRFALENLRFLLLVSAQLNWPVPA